MAGALPLGEPAPPDGQLPSAALSRLREVPLGLYLHVPFCTSRCGYCDFNTYTAAELGGPGATVSPANLAGLLGRELQLAASVMAGRGAPPLATVFLGGGTPTLLAPAQVGTLLEQVESILGLVAGAEVTIEANPDTVDARSLADLLAAGCTRISLGMQSAVPQVLSVLERTHDPAAVPRAVRAARDAGFPSVSVDLIYGAPGETLADWQQTLAAVAELDVDHVSAYSLIVEEGTRLAAAVRRGQLAAPDDDLMAQMYAIADEAFSQAGMPWYELSNWSRPGHECRHNLGYWKGDNWWGAGPGAHSHVGGVRWWNRKHPAAWAAGLRAGISPAQAREVVTVRQQEWERVMLAVRLASGVELRGARQLRVGEQLCAEGLAEHAGGEPARIRLTLAGRLLADAVTLRLVE